MIKTILLILVTIFIPPVGVFLVAGCGIDLLINILLTCLGYFPGHIHAFYLEYVYYKRRDEARAGIYDTRRAPGVYSSRVQRGGKHGHSVPANAPAPSSLPQGYAQPAPGPQQGYPVPNQPQPQQGYGTMR